MFRATTSSAGQATNRSYGVQMMHRLLVPQASRRRALLARGNGPAKAPGFAGNDPGVSVTPEQHHGAADKRGDPGHRARDVDDQHGANVRTVVLDLVRPCIVKQKPFAFPPSVVLVLDANGRGEVCVTSIPR